MKTTKIVCIAMLLMLCIQPASAMHWIVGNVEDENGRPVAFDCTVIMYYPGNRGNYISTTTGLLESSMDVSDYYMLDAQMLPNGSQYINNNWLQTNTVCIEVIDNGNGYVSDPVSITMSEYSWDLAPTMTLRR